MPETIPRFRTLGDVARDYERWRMTQGLLREEKTTKPKNGGVNSVRTE
jgi:hypothetical protein